MPPELACVEETVLLDAEEYLLGLEREMEEKECWEAMQPGVLGEKGVYEFARWAHRDAAI